MFQLSSFYCRVLAGRSVQVGGFRAVLELGAFGGSWGSGAGLLDLGAVEFGS